MLRTRLWMGAILIALTVGMLLVDRYTEPWYPFLFVFFTGVAILGTVELVDLLPPASRPSRWLCVVGVFVVILANWLSHIFAHLGAPSKQANSWFDLIHTMAWLYAWLYIAAVFAIVVLAAFLVEMVTFREPGNAVMRLALTVWVVAYLAVLPSFLTQVRWFPAVGAPALALCIFVPKSCDIGAYFTGRLFGRHRMTPVLSPKKTWEGLAGGLVTAALVAFGLNRGWPVLRSDLSALGFGLIVGGAGVLGDLAESMIKRDCQRKDASAVVPGFGGVLDVIDAVLFAAPVAFWWIRFG